MLVTKISNKICKTGEFKTSTFYKADCTCSYEEHEQTLDVCLDEKCEMIDINIYSKSYPKDFIYQNYSEMGILSTISYHLRVIKQKIRWIFSIIFKGYIEVESVFSLCGDEQVNDYIFAIMSAAERIKANQIKNNELYDVNEDGYYL